MKSLKFDHALAQMIASGQKTATWRINDEKELSVDDEVIVIDKVDPKNKNTWKALGIATLNKVVEQRLGEIDLQRIQGHEKYSTQDEMYTYYRQYYGPKIGPDTPVKIIDFSFEPYKEKKALEEIEAKNTTNLTEIKFYGDGGSRGNPGPSASGYVLLDMNDTILETNGEYLGVTTNNQAEYHSLKLGVDRATKLGVKKLHIYMDSLLVINQMKGIFKVKNRDLWPVYEAIKQQCKSFESIDFNHVPREFNKLADAEVNRILDSQKTR